MMGSGTPCWPPYPSARREESPTADLSTTGGGQHPGRSRGRHRAVLMATSSQNSRPLSGSSYWQLTMHSYVTTRRSPQAERWTRA